MNILKNVKPEIRKEIIQRELASRNLYHFRKYFSDITDQGKFEEREFQRIIGDKLTDAIVNKKHRKIIIQAPPQTGKALEINTPILTPEGWKRIVDLNPGDFVYDPEGNPTKVVAKSPIWKNRRLIKVTSDLSDDFILADENHEWVDLNYKKHETKDLLNAKLIIPDLEYKKRTLTFEEYGIGDTVCIEVEHHSHLFLAGKELLVTCNSALISKCLPPFIFGVDPKAAILTASHTNDLSKHMAINVRRIMETSQYKNIFPNSVITTNKVDGISTQQEFTLSNGIGYYKSFSVGSKSIHGRGANYIIVDDPIGSGSNCTPLYFKKLLDWYTTDIRSRAREGCVEIIMATRFHQSDLSGQMLELEGDEWLVLSFPMLCEDINDPLEYRKEGEPLINSIQWCEQKRKEVGSMAWASLYQQRPSPKEGAIFKEEYLNYYKKIDNYINVEDKIIDIESLYKFCTVDLALGKSTSDYTVIQTWAYDRKEKNLYLIDQIRDKLNGPETLKKLQDINNSIYNIFIEEVSLQTFFHQFSLEKNLKIRGMKPKGSKEDRAEGSLFMFEQRRVYFPKNMYWIDQLREELLLFPNSKNDDQVDCIIYAVQATQTILKTYSKVHAPDNKKSIRPSLREEEDFI